MSTMPHDPVCGMTVDAATTPHHLVYNDDTYYFCSDHCLQRFQSAPTEYLIEPETLTAIGPDRATYTCPMHPEVIQEGPGSPAASTDDQPHDDPENEEHHAHRIEYLIQRAERHVEHVDVHRLP